MTDESAQVSPPFEQSEGQTAETLEYRKIPPDELREILEQHRKWVETEGKKGKQANLENANLQKADLRNANLQEANLLYANLQEADLGAANLKKANLRGANLQKARLFGTALHQAVLWEANLQKADLFKANLQKATLLEATLKESVLQDADLTDATGLLAVQLAGANVSGAKLPEHINLLEGLARVEEISKKAGKLFISILLGCVYAWLTIGTTTDPLLLTNSSSSPLPIIQASIPIAYFFVGAPLLLISLYLWFHLYLQDLWANLAKCPAVFQDGVRLDDKAYPWPFISYVCPHFTPLRKDRFLESRLKVGVSIMLGWYIVPLTFIPFWLRYLPSHHWPVTIFHISLLVVGFIYAFQAHILARRTLRGERGEPLPFKKNLIGLKPYGELIKRFWGMILAGPAILVLALLVSDGAINGTRANLGSERESGWHQKLIPVLLPYVWSRAFADFTEQDVSTKPPNWFRDGELPRLVKGAPLKEANLRLLSARGAFLVKADLRFAHLEEADLNGAHLEKANLSYAHLEEASLVEANLQEADLSVANLEKAELSEANLREANLFRANLQKANLYGANLQEANLQGASLQEANLEEADLLEANLGGADLRGAKHLTQVQLNQACVNEQTKLPEGLTRPKPCSKEDLGEK